MTEYISQENYKKILRSIFINAVEATIKYNDFKKGVLKYKSHYKESELKSEAILAENWFLGIGNYHGKWSFLDICQGLSLLHDGLEYLEMCANVSWEELKQRKGIHEIPESEQIELKRLLKEGYTVHQISKKLGHSWGIIKKYIDKI